MNTNSISSVNTTTESPVITTTESPAATITRSPVCNTASKNTVMMTEYSFFYKAYNDFQIYHITCKEISFYDCLTLTQNNDQPNNLHVFYYQQPNDRKIYQVTCEVASYSFIIYLLNKFNYGIELNLDYQENLNFSREHKENLESHLKQDLINYLIPIEQFNIVNFGIDSDGSGTGLVNSSQPHTTDYDNFNHQQGDSNGNHNTDENIYQP